LTHAGRWFKVVAMSDNPAPEPSRLAEVARLFLKLGFTAFGGPAAHVALMEAEVVTRRKWLDRQHFLDILSAVNFVPGPNSTELAIHLGLVRAGWRGLIVAGVCFIVPAMLIIFPLAWCYVTYGATPGVGEALTAVKACMVAIIAMAMWRFARTGIKDAFTALVAGTAVVVSVLLQYFRVPQQELIILAAAAVAGFFWYGRTLRSASPAEVQPAAQRSGKALRSLPLVALPLSAGAGFSGQLLAMALFFLKVGATLFGSGYVLASFLHSGLVEQHKWLSEQQLLDAIAVGQITPGPLLTTATFIGFVLGSQKFGGGVGGGIAAGVVATVAIFLPSFLFICALGPVLPRLRASRKARGALDGMNAAVVALILVVTIWFARSVMIKTTGGVDLLSVFVFIAALAILLLTRVNATWLILASGAIGAMVHFLP
jgi:chromate transporter